jgi:hypothetical protein
MSLIAVAIPPLCGGIFNESVCARFFKGQTGFSKLSWTPEHFANSWAMIWAQIVDRNGVESPIISNAYAGGDRSKVVSSGHVVDSIPIDTGVGLEGTLAELKTASFNRSVIFPDILFSCSRTRGFNMRGFDEAGFDGTFPERAVETGDELPMLVAGLADLMLAFDPDDTIGEDWRPIGIGDRENPVTRLR